MTKKKFNIFTIDDLTGGINTRDYPSEIENKECQMLENFNFSWNKLITWPWHEATTNPINWKIGALTIDSNDIWTISDWDLYKNWEWLPNKYGIFISFNIQNFLTNIDYIVTINNTEYTFNWVNISDIIEDISSQLSWNFNILKQEDSVIIYSDSPITYSYDNKKSYIIYTTDFIYWDTWKTFTISIIVNWVTYSYDYNYTDLTIDNKEIIENIMTGLVWEIPSQYNPKLVNINALWEITEDYYYAKGILISSVDTVIPNNVIKLDYKSDLNVNVFYRLWAWWTILFKLDNHTIYAPSWYRISYFSSTNLTSSDTITIDWTTTNFNWINRSDFWNHINLPSVYIRKTLFDNWDARELMFVRRDWKPIQSISGTWLFSNIWSVFNSWYSNFSWGWSVWDFYSSRCYIWDVTPKHFLVEDVKEVIANSILYQVWLLSWYTSSYSYDTSVWNKILSIKKWDWEYIDIWKYPEWYDKNISISFFWIKEKEYIKTDINSVWEVWIPLYDLQWWNTTYFWNITVWNHWWVLVVNKEWGASYFYEWLKANIWIDSVWLPTVWTIYNGKIVLWWYEWNDNIVFWQTSSPTQPLSILNFTDYDSWWQSVSWGDKWKITGMIVWENWLLVFKDNSIWYTNQEIDKPESYSFNLKFSKATSNWALTQNVITEVDQEIFYLDWNTRTVRRLWYEKNLTTLRDVWISHNIEKYLKELPEEQELATSHFSYPNYVLSLSDHSWWTITYWDNKTYYTNNKHFIYNVDNKSWTTRTSLPWFIVSHKWYFWHLDKKVYKDMHWYTTEGWYFLSKMYNLWDDVWMNKFWRFEIVWSFLNEASNITVKIIIDWEVIEERYITWNNDNWHISQSFRERIDLYDIWQTIEFSINWNWPVEIYDINIYYTPTNTKEYYF